MIKTQSFDAVLDFPAAEFGKSGRAVLLLGDLRVSAEFAVYEIPGTAAAPRVSVHPSGRLTAKWMDAFEVQTGNGRTLGRGTVLYPDAPDAKEIRLSRRKGLLELLASGEKGMAQALAEEQGVLGLRAEAIATFSRLDETRIETLARALEEEGKVRILSFSPLFMVAQDSLDFLREKILAFLGRYHKTHPGQRGATLEKIESRFGVPASVLNLVIRIMVKEGQVALDKDLVGLAGFRIPLSGEDEKTLAKLEEMLLGGEFGSVSLDDLQEQFHLSPEKLRTLISVLTERNTIVEGRDGFILHSHWLDEVVKKIRESGKKELTVGDFKAMTGLTRKYAIPLLELLDEMRITRRKGAVRDVLK